MILLTPPIISRKNEFEISQFFMTSLYILRKVCAPNNCTLGHTAHPIISRKKTNSKFHNFLLTSLYIFREVCAPNNCALAPGEEVCRDESRMQMQNVPEEDCDLQPEETCHMEAVLVPRCVHIYFRPGGTFRGSSGFVRSNFVK